LCLSKQPCKGAAAEERPCDQQECQNRVERAGSSQRDSCVGRCGQTAPLGQCQCSPECETFGDCCRDFVSVCSLAADTTTTASAAVEATTAPPATSVRPPTATTAAPPPSSSAAGATDKELAEFGERLLALDENNVAEKIVLNTGCTTRVGSPNDCSNNRLFVQVIEYIIELCNKVD
jgi:Somatomedin B domain